MFELLKQKTIFVTGKGGVGKSTIAAALAQSGATRGRKTLLASTDDRCDAAKFLGATKFTYAPTQISDGIFHSHLDWDRVLDEYLRVTLKLPGAYRFGPLRKIFDYVANAAPGVREVLLGGKIGFEHRAEDKGKPRWDLIVVDAPVSGQIVAYLRGPRTIQELVGASRIRTQTQWVREILEDPNQACVVVVATPEEMPVVETVELCKTITAETGVHVAAIIANRVVARPPTVGNDADALALRISAQQTPLLARLGQVGLPISVVDLFGFETHGANETTCIIESLAR